MGEVTNLKIALGAVEEAIRMLEQDDFDDVDDVTDQLRTAVSFLEFEEASVAKG